MSLTPPTLFICKTQVISTQINPNNNSMSSLRITVVGAGVVGLTAALELKRAHPDYAITIIGHYLPGDLSPDYVSPFAGANWCSFATGKEPELQQLDTIGYHRFLELAKDPRSGVWNTTDASYLRETTEIPWFKDVVKDFQVIPQDQLLPETVFGFQFSGVVISVPIYLTYLVQRNLELGNDIKRVKINRIEDAVGVHTEGKADLVVNAAGLFGAQLSRNDPKRTYSIRGQTLLVRNNTSRTLCVDEFADRPTEMLYIMPRKEGGSIIGGVFDEVSKQTDEDPELTKRIIERALKYAPELVEGNNPPELDIVKVNVGFRPYRDGQIRIETDQERSWLIHCYGAGGGGYQGSYGFAKKVVNLVEKRAKI